MQESDIKIAPPKMSSVLNNGTLSEMDSVKEYITQRRIGNIKLAHILGETLGDSIDGVVCEIIDDDIVKYHLMTLYVYVVSRVLETHCPNQTIAHTAISAFYDKIETTRPVLFAGLSDNGAFSLYLYLNRMKAETADAMGTIFAHQCGGDDMNTSTEIGSNAYKKFRKHCVKEIEQMQFVSE